MVFAQSRQTVEIKDTLNLPTRYIEQGKIDAHAFLRERIFHIQPGYQSNKNFKDHIGFSDLLDLNLYKNNTFNTFTLQDIVQESEAYAKEMRIMDEQNEVIDKD